MKAPSADFNQVAVAMFSIFVAAALTMTVVSVIKYAVDNFAQ